MGDELPESKLEKAVCEGSLDELRSLVAEEGFDPASETAKVALRSAAEGGKWDALRFLVEHARVGVSSVDTGGVVLQYAAVAGRLDMLQLVLDGGAELTGKVGHNVLLSSASTGQLDVLTFAVEHGADVASGGGRAAWGAAKASVWAAVQYIIGTGADVLNGFGVQLLALAAVREQEAIVKLLADRGVTVNTEAGAQALRSLPATESWDLCSELVRYLVLGGVDVRSGAGDLALVTAARHGDLEAVQCLAKGMDMSSGAAGEALAQAGELGSTEGQRAVASYLMGLGAVAPEPPALVLDEDF